MLVTSKGVSLGLWSCYSLSKFVDNEIVEVRRNVACAVSSLISCALCALCALLLLVQFKVRYKV